MGINGDVGVGRLPTANVDVTFHDILENLTGAFMGNFVASNGQFLFGADLVWSRLKDNVDFNVADGPLSDRLAGVVAKFQQNMTIASGVAGYRIPVGPPELETLWHGRAALPEHQGEDRHHPERSPVRPFRVGDAGLDRPHRRPGDELQDQRQVVHRRGSRYRRLQCRFKPDLAGPDRGRLLLDTDDLTALGYRALYTDYKNSNANGGSFRYETTIHGPYATLSVHF